MEEVSGQIRVITKEAFSGKRIHKKFCTVTVFFVFLIFSWLFIQTHTDKMNGLSLSWDTAQNVNTCGPGAVLRPSIFLLYIWVFIRKSAK